jgi:hypothetical protein
MAKPLLSQAVEAIEQLLLFTGSAAARLLHPFMLRLGLLQTSAAQAVMVSGSQLLASLCRQLHLQTPAPSKQRTAGKRLLAGPTGLLAAAQNETEQITRFHPIPVLLINVLY